MADSNEKEVVASDHAKLTPLKLVAAVGAPGAEVPTTTLRQALQPVACWCLTDSRFDFDSSVVLPSAKSEITQLKAKHDEHPETRLSVFGHADPTGREDYNKQLSGRRAAAVYGLLTRDVDLWEALYKDEIENDTWGTRSVQIMLGAIEKTPGVPFFSGSPSEEVTPEADAAIRDFQTDAGLKVDGDAGPDTRKALFPKYMDLLAQDVVFDVGQFLGQGRDDKGKADFQGCGEFNPLSIFSTEEAKRFQDPALKDERDAENLVNRRVVIYMFPESLDIQPDTWPCPRFQEGVADCKKRFFSDAKVRLQSGTARRVYDAKPDTFACRFYHRLSSNSPCERPTGALGSVDVLLSTRPATRSQSASERFTLRSQDGAYTQTRAAADAATLDENHLVVRFTGVPRDGSFDLILGYDKAEVPLLQGATFDKLDAELPTREAQDPRNIVEQDPERSESLDDTNLSPWEDASS